MSVAVLLSGGLDSAVLLADEAARGARVQPVYVSVGLAWEAAERQAVEAFLSRGVPGAAFPPLAALTVDMSDVYPAAHWARQGTPPAYHTPDEDVYLPGRNIILLTKAAVFCAGAELDRLVIGTLDHNPFPDATEEFRESIARALSLGLGTTLRIEAPYARSSKAAVIERGTSLGVRLELTLSCMSPHDNAGGFPRHCGVCSKCRERHDAFVEAGVADLTDYADRRFTGRHT